MPDLIEFLDRHKVAYSQTHKHSRQGWAQIETCPECAAELTRREGEVQHYCTNDLACPPQVKGRMEHFISRKAMNIDGIGAETIDSFYQKGLVNNVADLYDLSFDENRESRL